MQVNETYGTWEIDVNLGSEYLSKQSLWLSLHVRPVDYHKADMSVVVLAAG